MQGNKHTYIESGIFYKQYTKNEFTYLKMLHGITGLEIGYNSEYISMPAGHVISIDTIPQNKRQNLKHIITANLPFMIQQVSYLNELGIYYSDCMQWLYYNNRMYLIDFDTAFTAEIDYNYNNFDLLINFLAAFDISSSFITESLHNLDLFRTEDIEFTFYNDTEKQLYNSLNNPTLQKNHIYYSRNSRHIQINMPNIHIYGESGNMVITETILNPEISHEWELIKII
jgi:hypothetical protein